MRAGRLTPLNQAIGRRQSGVPRRIGLDDRTEIGRRILSRVLRMMAARPLRRRRFRSSLPSCSLAFTVGAISLYSEIVGADASGTMTLNLPPAGNRFRQLEDFNSAAKYAIAPQALRRQSVAG